MANDNVVRNETLFGTKNINSSYNIIRHWITSVFVTLSASVLHFTFEMWPIYSIGCKNWELFRVLYRKNATTFGIQDDYPGI